MSSYSFSLNNYHAISNAEIEIYGITVIAGCNGCGKSTIARWLYALIFYSNRYNYSLDKELLDSINQIVSRMQRILRNFESHSLMTLARLRRIPYSILSSGNNESPSYSGIEDYSGVIDAFTDKLKYFQSAIESEIDANDYDPDFIDWLITTLDVEGADEETFLEDFYNNNIDDLHNLVDETIQLKLKRNLSKLFGFIKSELNITDRAPGSINLKENGQSLIDKDSFKIPLDLHNAVYVDTPMALSNFMSFDNKIWDNLQSAMTVQRMPMPDTARKLVLRIRKLIGGEILMDSDDFDPVIRYRRKEDNLDIPVYEAATGLKTFAYMLRLIENGYLNENSILIIDEPEVHLHPQWIVEFARVLVLLNKEVGCKILIASHNPDMVAAIRSIAAAQDSLETTRFYQAEKDPEGLRYHYNDLGHEIQEIFRSFNIALERIKDYGE